MSYKDLNHQKALIDKHLAMANQCFEYSKLDDGDVHLTIAKILFDGFKNANPSYEEESLNHLAQAIS